MLLQLFGDFMALFANANKGKGTKTFTRKDFYKISYDTQLKQEVDPELFNRIGRRLGFTIKGKKSDE